MLMETGRSNTQLTLIFMFHGQRERDGGRNDLSSSFPEPPSSIRPVTSYYVRIALFCQTRNKKG